MTGGVLGVSGVGLYMFGSRCVYTTDFLNIHNRVVSRTVLRTYHFSPFPSSGRNNSDICCFGLCNEDSLDSSNVCRVIPFVGNYFPSYYCID